MRAAKTLPAEEIQDMRHERIDPRQACSEIDIAAIWPAGAQIATLPIPEPGEPFGSASFRVAPQAPRRAPAALRALIAASCAGLAAALVFILQGS